MLIIRGRAPLRKNVLMAEIVERKGIDLVNEILRQRVSLNGWNAKL